MTWNPGPMKFWDGVYEHPKDFFDPKDEARIQAQYLLKHPEMQALASMFIAHMTRQPLRERTNVLKAAGLFFTRPADVLQIEVDEFLKKTNKIGPKEEMQKRCRTYPIPRSVSVPDCACPSIKTPSINSVYSSFITKSSSATTLPSVIVKEQVALTLEEGIWQLVARALNNALNIMYAAREHDIIYDEAYLCLMTCSHRAVDAVWGPRLEEINAIIDILIDDTRRITSESRRLKLLATDKLPIKVNRLKNNFKGYAESEEYPDLKKKEILETLQSRVGTYNRYPKDKFGVYLSTCDRSLDLSTTYVPPGCDEEEEEESLVMSVDDLSLDDSKYEVESNVTV